VIVKRRKNSGINKSAVITTKNEAISINQPNHKAPEKSHDTKPALKSGTIVPYRDI
jgi:hypothetical protein